MESSGAAEANLGRLLNTPSRLIGLPPAVVEMKSSEVGRNLGRIIKYNLEPGKRFKWSPAVLPEENCGDKQYPIRVIGLKTNLYVFDPNSMLSSVH